MTRRIVVTTEHGEVIQPGVDGFGRFFELLEMNTSVELITDHAAIATADAVLVGGPLRCLDEPLMKAIRGAVREGAGLLLTAHGGGSRPVVSPRARSNLSALVPGVAFWDEVLYQPTAMEGEENLSVRLAADAVLGSGAAVRYAAGCSFVLHPWLVEEVARLDAPVDDPYICAAREVFAEAEGYLLTSGDEEDAARTPQGCVYAELRCGSGRVVVLGSTYTLSDLELVEDDTPSLAERMVLFWLGLEPAAELKRRMAQPQRHRLLQGYPMAPLMLPPRSWPDRRKWRMPSVLQERGGVHRAALLGVLPHPYCNPRVRGCGFCTFPQEKLDRSRLPDVVAAVEREVRAFARERDDARDIAIPAVYLGGGTANLTPPGEFESLCDALAEVFTLDQAEITLEGVPRYFQIGDHHLMRALRGRFPDAALRISVGVQTLDPGWLKKMGRAGFGDRRCFEEVVEHAHAMGFAASADLLINLPGQPVEQMLSDIDGVVALGFDQVCLYHLVLFAGLGTPWSDDPELLGAMGTNAAAFANWRRCVDRLKAHGFEQVTLTNFARRPAARPDFRYEPLGFEPADHDLLGFGPGAINAWSDASFHAGGKLINPRDAQRYTGMVQASQYTVWRRWFWSERADQAILFLTRSVARLRVDQEKYEALFGEPLHAGFGAEVEALVSAGLMQERGRWLELTEAGRFFADSVAGLFAWRRAPAVRLRHERVLDVRVPWSMKHRFRDNVPLRYRDPNESSYGHMG